MQDQFQFFTAVVMLVMRAGFALAGDAQDLVGAGVEQVDGRVHDPVEQVQRHGGPQRQQFRFADRPGFGGQFADHDVQVRNDEEGGEERNRLDHFGGIDAHGTQHRCQEVRERRFSDPTQAQGGEGDTQLAGRQVGIELTVYGAQDVPAPAVFIRDGLDPGRAQLDHGKFRRNEKSVEQNQDQSKKNHAEVGENCSEGQARGRVHDGVLRVPCIRKERKVRT
ncbi:hypothetical protein OKW11_002879 [Pseudomonas baetica]|nr:hypothetical protein [Pseudomonas baetica]